MYKATAPLPKCSIVGMLIDILETLVCFSGEETIIYWQHANSCGTMHAWYKPYIVRDICNGHEERPGLNFTRKCKMRFVGCKNNWNNCGSSSWWQSRVDFFLGILINFPKMHTCFLHHQLPVHSSEYMRSQLEYNFSGAHFMWLAKCTSPMRAFNNVRLFRCQKVT